MCLHKQEGNLFEENLLEDGQHIFFNFSNLQLLPVNVWSQVF